MRGVLRIALATMLTIGLFACGSDEQTGTTALSSPIVPITSTSSETTTVVTATSPPVSATAATDTTLPITETTSPPIGTVNPTTVTTPLSDDGGVSLATGTVFGLRPGDLVDVDAEAVRISNGEVGPLALDTGWYYIAKDASQEDCIGDNSYRVLWWGDLRLAFFKNGDQVRLWIWSVGDRNVTHFGRSEPYEVPTSTPTGLVSEEGITVGGSETLIDLDQLHSQSNTLDDGTELLMSAVVGSPVSTFVGVRDGAITGFGAQLEFC